MGTKHFMSVTVMFSCIVRKACASIDAIFGGLESDINESSWFVKGWSKFYPFKAVIGIDVAFAISFRKWLKHFETSVHQRIQLDALPPSASTIILILSSSQSGFPFYARPPRISSAVAPTAMTRCDETQNMSKELTRAPKHSAKRCRVSSCRQWKNALLFAAVKPVTHTMDSRFQNLQISWIIFPSSCRGLATRSIENSSLLLRSDSW